MDTSNLVKLFVDEPESDHVEQTVADSAIATSWLAYAEGRAAIAAANRAGNRTVRGGEPLSSMTYPATMRAFDSFWLTVVPIEVTEGIVRAAGALAERHSLRGGDSVHLASALSLHSITAEQVVFSASDSRLRAGAEAEGLVVV